MKKYYKNKKSLKEIIVNRKWVIFRLVIAFIPAFTCGIFFWQSDSIVVSMLNILNWFLTGVGLFAIFCNMSIFKSINREDVENIYKEKKQKEIDQAYIKNKASL